MWERARLRLPLLALNLNRIAIAGALGCIVTWILWTHEHDPNEGIGGPSPIEASRPALSDADSISDIRSADRSTTARLPGNDSVELSVVDLDSGAALAGARCFLVGLTRSFSLGATDADGVLTLELPEKALMQSDPLLLGAHLEGFLRSVVAVRSEELRPGSRVPLRLTPTSEFQVELSGCEEVDVALLPPGSNYPTWSINWRNQCADWMEFTRSRALNVDELVSRAFGDDVETMRGDVESWNSPEPSGGHTTQIQRILADPWLLRAVCTAGSDPIEPSTRTSSQLTWSNVPAGEGYAWTVLNGSAGEVTPKRATPAITAHDFFSFKEAITAPFQLAPGEIFRVRHQCVQGATLIGVIHEKYLTKQLASSPRIAVKRSYWGRAQDGTPVKRWDTFRKESFDAFGAIVIEDLPAGEALVRCEWSAHGSTYKFSRKVVLEEGEVCDLGVIDAAGGITANLELQFELNDGSLLSPEDPRWTQVFLEGNFLVSLTRSKSGDILESGNHFVLFDESGVQSLGGISPGEYQYSIAGRAISRLRNAGLYPLNGSMSMPLYIDGFGGLTSVTIPVDGTQRRQVLLTVEHRNDPNLSIDAQVYSRLHEQEITRVRVSRKSATTSLVSFEALPGECAVEVQGRTGRTRQDRAMCARLDFNLADGELPFLVETKLEDACSVRGSFQAGADAPTHVWAVSAELWSDRVSCTQFSQELQSAVDPQDQSFQIFGLVTGHEYVLLPIGLTFTATQDLDIPLGTGDCALWRAREQAIVDSRR